MAFLYRDRDIDSCDFGLHSRDCPHHSRESIHRQSNSVLERDLPRHSSCQATHDHRRPRSRSRLRRYHTGHPAVCNVCEDDYCRCGRISSILETDISDNNSQYEYEPRERRSTMMEFGHDGRKPSKVAEQTLRIQLFEAKKKDKKWEEATAIYQDAVACDKSRGSSDQMLKLKASFADMQVIQGNCKEAEHLLDDIQKWKDLPSGLEKQCYCIRGKILCARKRYNEAETLYRKLYDRASKDEWSLEMGDEMCNAIALQGDHDLARLEQTSLLEKRKKSLGVGHPSTVKNATAAVENIRKFMQKMPKDSGSAMERTTKRKEAMEAEIEYLLRDIWMSMAGNPQKQEVGMLKIGHDLGLSLSNQKKFSEAESILNDVWYGRKAKLGELNKDAMSTGICLGQAMYRQEFDTPKYHHDLGGIGYGQVLNLGSHYRGNLAKCRRAEPIFRSILASSDGKTYGDDNALAMVANAHLGIIYARLGKYAKAESLLMHSMNVPSGSGGVIMPPQDLMRFALEQARSRYYGADGSRGKVIKMNSGHGRRFLQPAAQSLLRPNKIIDEGRSFRRLAIAPGASDSQSHTKGPIGQGVGFYHAGIVNGKFWRQLGDYELAKNAYALTWNQPTAVPEEAKIRADCGDKYAVCLRKLGQYEKARSVLQEVKALKRQLYPGERNRERIRTGHIIRGVEDATNDRNTSTRSRIPSIRSIMLL